MPSFGNLRRLTPREMWPNEAYDFTPWLAQNIPLLGATLGLELELKAREADVGDFSLDLLATDLGSGRVVIIENQLTPTDHDHLGKLLTYAAGYDASVVVWISERIREEHRQTLEWLNQRTAEDTEFFGVVIEVLQIDESRPALNFLPVVFPNSWRKGHTKPRDAEPSSRGVAYQAFFQALLDELRETHQFTSARAAQPQSWQTYSTGVSGLKYASAFSLDKHFRVELYIDYGDQSVNKAFFTFMESEKEAICAELGMTLEWERLEEKRASRIAVYREGSIESTEEHLAALRAWAIDTLLKFRSVFGPRLRPLIQKVALSSSLTTSVPPV